MQKEIYIQKRELYVNNPSLKYTLMELYDLGVDIENLANNILYIEDLAIANFLKHKNLNNKNKLNMMKSLMTEAISNPYFYFSQVDGNLLFTKESLALIYAVINRIPCIVDYSEYKKSQVIAFVSAIINWVDLTTPQLQICKLVERVSNASRDRFYGTIMRRPGNEYMSLSSMSKSGDVSYVYKYGLIIGEDIKMNSGVNRSIVKIANIFNTDDKDKLPIRVLTKSNSQLSDKEFLHWDYKMFDMPLDELFNELDKTETKSILINFK